MKPIQFVIIGAGLIGPRHAESVLKRNDCSLFAIVDRSAKGPEVARSCDALHFKTIHDMFLFCERYDEYPDAAIVCTPNDSHAEIGMLLAERGIHMLVEKPMAASAVDCIRLIDYCERHNVKLLIGHHRRFNPYIVMSKEQIHRIGTPVAIQGVWALKKHQEYFDEKAWRRSKYSGGGTIMINLIHDLDLLHFEAGTGENPLIPHHQDVSGFYRVFGSSGTLSVPDLTLYHQNNTPAREHSWWKPVEVESLGGLFPQPKQTPEPADAFSALTPPSSFDSKANFGPLTQELPKPFDLQLEHFVNLITGVETEVKCSGYDALQSLLCIEAVMKSIEQGVPQVVQTAGELRNQMHAM
ncbi:hypothetical protein JCM33374_g4292 [Metschnikowia sp. JCM 33374]|nr:hypothetical protein JCM33374_g4292 [Metschnikowia sp. JCM 33374]